jgi:hypothetical protein
MIHSCSPFARADNLAAGFSGFVSIRYDIQWGRRLRRGCKKNSSS